MHVDSKGTIIEMREIVTCIVCEMIISHNLTWDDLLPWGDHISPKWAKFLKTPSIAAEASLGPDLVFTKKNWSPCTAFKMKQVLWILTNWLNMSSKRWERLKLQCTLFLMVSPSLWIPSWWTDLSICTYRVIHPLFRYVWRHISAEPSRNYNRAAIRHRSS